MGNVSTRLGRSNSNSSAGSDQGSNATRSASGRSWADVAAISQQQQRNIVGERLGGFTRGNALNAGQGGGRAGNAMRSVPELKQASNVRNPCNVRSNQVVVVSESEGAEGALASIRFMVDAECDGTATVHLVATQIEPKVNQEAASAAQGQVAGSSGKEPEATQEGGFFKSIASYSIPFSAGSGQTLETAPFVDASTINTEDLLYHKGSKTFPLVIVVAKSSSFGKENSEFTYADNQCVFFSLTRSEGGAFAAAEFQRAVAMNNTLYVVKEIFGTSGASDDVEKEDDGKECVICLSHPKNTTILPCMHMCLCVECAQLLSTSNAKCPLCRSRIAEFWELSGK